MQSNLDKLKEKSFKYCGKSYTVKELKIVNSRAVILTDRQTFVKTSTELSAFMDNIEFVKVLKPADVVPSLIKEVYNDSVDVVKGNILPPPVDLVPEIAVALVPEIVVAKGNAEKVSDKLMEMFEKLSDKPTKGTYEQATAMVNMANSIVNVQMAQIKFLALKK